MENINIPVLYALIAASLSLVALLFVIYGMRNEVLAPKTWLTPLTWLIFLSLLVSMIGIIPVIFYQFYRLIGQESATLRDLANVTGNTSRLASAVLLVLIARFIGKYRGGDR